MAITFGNPQITDTTSTVGSLTYTSYACEAGSDNILVVCVGLESPSGTAGVASVTHNGVNLTQRKAVSGTNGACEIWDLQLGSTNPTGNIVATFNSNNNASWVGAITAHGLAQAAPEASASRTGASAGTYTLTTASANAGIVTAISTNTGGSAPVVGGSDTTGQVSKQSGYDLTGATIMWAFGASTDAGAAGSKTIQWTGGSTRFNEVAVSYAAYGAGGGGSTIPLMYYNRMMQGIA